MNETPCTDFDTQCDFLRERIKQDCKYPGDLPYEVKRLMSIFFFHLKSKWRSSSRNNFFFLLNIIIGCRLRLAFHYLKILSKKRLVDHKHTSQRAAKEQKEGKLRFCAHSSTPQHLFMQPKCLLEQVGTLMLPLLLKKQP